MQSTQTVLNPLSMILHECSLNIIYKLYNINLNTLNIQNTHISNFSNICLRWPFPCQDGAAPLGADDLINVQMPSQIKDTRRDGSFVFANLFGKCPFS